MRDRMMTTLTHPIQQDSSPWLPVLGLKEVRELDRQDDSFLESFLSNMETSNVIPANIGFLRDDSTYQEESQP